MAAQNFQIDLDETTYHALVDRAQREGEQVSHILADLLTMYANAASGGLTTYTVQPGDTLAQIARKVYNDPYKYTVIQHANNIDASGKIIVGQVLLVPKIVPVMPFL